MSASTEGVFDPKSADPGWKGLYIVGGIAALIAVLFFRRNLGAEIMALGEFGLMDLPAAPLTGALDWFVLFQDNVLLGLVLFEVVDLINFALVALILLALYGALHRTNRSAMIIATACGLLGTTVYLSTNQAFSMLALSNHHAAATTEAQRSMFLAAGEALLAIYNPNAAYQSFGYNASLFLVLLAGLIISIVMLRHSLFGKWTAWIGILANGLGLLYFVALFAAPAIYYLPTVLSALFRVTWYILIALKLLRLGWPRSNGNEEADGS